MEIFSAHNFGACTNVSCLRGFIQWTICLRLVLHSPSISILKFSDRQGFYLWYIIYIVWTWNVKYTCIFAFLFFLKQFEVDTFATIDCEIATFNWKPLIFLTLYHRLRPSNFLCIWLGFACSVWKRCQVPTQAGVNSRGGTKQPCLHEDEPRRTGACAEGREENRHRIRRYHQIRGQTCAYT